MHPEQQLSIARNSEGATSMAVISQQGAALNQLVLKGVSVIDSSKLASPIDIKFGSLLAPWPNRIAEGKYQFKGEQYESEKLDRLGNAIHGLLFDRLVEVANHSENKITFRHSFGEDDFYPFSIDLTVTYELTEDELLVTSIAKNHGDTAPFGIGFHPYFLAGENFTVTAPFTQKILANEKMIPTSTVEIDRFEYSGGQLDGCFLGAEEVQLSTEHFSLEVKLLEGYTHTMLYRPPIELGESLIAIEPMSCAANAFNSDIESTLLESGETKRFVFSIRMS